MNMRAIDTGTGPQPSRLADRSTPFVYNCWYVAAFAEEVGRHLLARKLLGRPLVLYRTEAGEPVAMDDRCLHRSFPLSKSILDGDTIVCGYHGMRYDCSGRCIEVPSQPHTPPGLAVRSYPLIQKGPLLWIWLGEAEADPAQLPDIDCWLSDPSWATSRGYIPLRAHYIALHENLLDLTHLSYLHRDTFGTPDYARAPFRTHIDQQNGRFGLSREVAPTRLPPLWADPSGLAGIDAVREVHSEFCAPSLHVVQVTLSSYADRTSDTTRSISRTAHLITPETASSTHYFIGHGRNFACDDGQVTATMHENLFRAFEEDREGLEAVEAMIRDCSGDTHEVSFTADRANLAMRRYLKQRADAERDGI